MKKVILITGGSDGLGKEMARLLSSSNQVIIVARNKSKLMSTAKEVGCEYYLCDITDYIQIQGAVKDVLKKYKKIDVLINNAGLWIEGNLDSNDPEDIKKLLEVNTLGTIWFSRAVIPTMKKQGKGEIINIVSQAGLAIAPERSVYYASKWAITGFTKSLSQELESEGIRVTGIYPGKLDTKLFEKAGNPKDLSDALDISEVAKAVEFVLYVKPSTHILDI
ncbi:MAG: SDR family oxidoreductase, partial [bacterium]|nr:SDR family oxidoreductase [bacterium]